MEEFKNERIRSFKDPEEKRKIEDALRRVRLGEKYSLVIGGKKRETGQVFKSMNPSSKDEVVGVIAKATDKEALEAMEVATETFKTWRFVPFEKRAEYLFKAAEIMRKRRYELDATLVYEVGKNWMEADADIAEAIDFLEFYAREAIRYGGEQPLTRIPTEKNELWYIPLGVGVVISPWNFPMSILCGMTSASFVSGNTVILKPSSDSPVTGAKFMEILEEAGLPDGVVNFLPGPGSKIGDTLVRSPFTRFIAFTGSKDVGLHIVELAAKPSPSQIWIKRVIAEMGGKDCIVVDSEADMEAAVTGVIAAVFGYQGQKCSACSRVVIVENIYDEFVDRLVEETKSLSIGPAKDNYPIGPVINERAMNSILEYIEIGKKEGRLLTGGERHSNNGYYIKPTIIADVDRNARIAQEEIFGPVLAVIKAKDFDEGLEIANCTQYGLTGSVYTKNKEKIEKAKRIFHCGNLYINRKCTAALVGVHPFGGFNMSGTDSKAGGRDYLLLFTQAKAISECM